MQKYYLIIPLAAAAILLILPFAIYSGNDIMRITSDSMVPTIQPHDIIIVEQIAIDQVQVGDIIVFDLYRPGLDIIAHRAYAIGNDSQGKLGIDTQGDNIGIPDSWTVYEENLIGIVVDVIPSMGIILLEPVRYSLVAIIVITSVSLLWDFYKEQNSKASN